MGLSTAVLAVLFGLTAILVGPVYITDGQGSNCCNNIPSECHFLCGTKGAPGFLARWGCRAKHYASVKTCQVNNAFDYVKTFGKQLTKSVANGFDTLSKTIKDKLEKAKDFVNLTIQELNVIPQDVLAALQEGLEYMKSSQFGGIVERLKYFTRQNLNSLLAKVPSDTFVDNLQALNLEVDFDNDQLRELAKAGLRAFGKNVGNWTKKTLKDMNKLLAGLETSEIVEIAGDALRLSHGILCDVNFNTDQKNALIVPVKKAFGEIAKWDVNAAKKICKVLEVFPPTQLLKISANVISKTAALLSNNTFFVPQIRVLVGKIKEAWGEVSSWDEVKLRDLGNLLNGLSKKDIASFLQNTIKKGLSEIGKINWNEPQAREWIKKVKEVLGSPDQWTVENIRDLGQTVVALLPSDLQKIGNETLFNALKYLKEIEVHVDQVLVIIQKVKAYRRLEDITKDDLLAMQKVLDGFLSSDIGKMSQVAVIAAFPELIIAKKVGMPILRAFIDQYKKARGDDKIGVFKSFFKALSRVELNETAISNIVDDINRAGVIDWDITQVLQLLQRIKRKWGNFSSADGDFSDKPIWGFQTFKKLGKIVLGLAKEDLRELPIRGIEDVMEVLGGVKGWSRGQIVAALRRVREYWEAEGLSFTNLTETDINSLGEFVAGLALKELKELPEKILHVTVKRLGECLDLPVDKLRSRAFLAIELLKNESGVDLLSSSQVADLGNLLKGVNRAVLKKITKEGFLDNLHQITRIKGMSDDRLWEIVQLAKKHFAKSDVGEWLAEHWQDLGPALKTLDVSEIGRISKGAFEEVIDQLGELDVFSKQQARALIGKAKEFWAQRDVSKWTGEQLRKLGSLVKGLNREEIKALSKDYFKEAIGAFGERLDLDEGTLAALAERAKEVFVDSNVAKFVVEELKMLGHVVLGLTSEDLGKLNIDSIDIIAALGKWKGWTQEQLAKLAPKIQDFLRNANKPDYYMSLGYLAPIMKPSDIKLLNKRAFDLSAKQFGESDIWTKEQLKALANKAITNWGPTALWEKAQVSELGNIIEGLKSSDLGKLSTTVVDAIKAKVIEKLDGEQLKAFTASHFTLMDPDQVGMISDAKVEYLSSEQQDAIQTVKDSDPVEPNPWPQESCAGPGCPSAAISILPNIILLISAIFVYFTNF